MTSWPIVNPMTRFIDIEEVLVLHKAILERAKSKGGVRDFTLLHSAIERPKATFSGQDLYPTVFAKAAALLQSICLNHAFTDGNKRTAWGTTKRFLWINRYHLLASVHSAADFMVYVDNQKPDLKEIAQWLKKHSRKIMKKELS